MDETDGFCQWLKANVLGKVENASGALTDNDDSYVFTYGRRTFNPDGSQKSWLTPKWEIFNFEALSSPLSEARSDTLDSDTMQGIEDAVSLSMGLSVEGSWAIGSFSAAVKVSNDKTAKSSRRQIRHDDVFTFQKYTVVPNTGFYVQHLTPEAEKYLRTRPAEEIASGNYLGIFYATSITFGGEIRETYVKDMEEGETSSTFSLAIEAAGDAVFAKRLQRAYLTLSRSSQRAVTFRRI